MNYLSRKCDFLEYSFHKASAAHVRVRKQCHDRKHVRIIRHVWACKRMRIRKGVRVTEASAANVRIRDLHV